MSDLEKVRQWLTIYPGIASMKELNVDYCPPNANNGSIAPSGLVEISRSRDILGNVTVEDRYDFAVHFVLLKADGDDEGATENADLVMDFQNWVQDQSIRGLAPTFGDEPLKETVKAQNGSIIGYNSKGVALYMVQLSVNFIKHYEVS